MLLKLCADLAEEGGVPPPGVDVPVLLLHHLLRGPHGLQVGGDGALELRPGLVEGSQAGLGWRGVMSEGCFVEIFLTWKIVVLSVGASAAAFTSFFFLNLLK